jgi:hypothetical protein
MRPFTSNSHLFLPMMLKCLEEAFGALAAGYRGRAGVRLRITVLSTAFVGD